MVILYPSWNYWPGVLEHWPTVFLLLAFICLMLHKIPQKASRKLTVCSLQGHSICYNLNVMVLSRMSLWILGLESNLIQKWRFLPGQFYLIPLLCYPSDISKIQTLAPLHEPTEGSNLHSCKRITIYSYQYDYIYSNLNWWGTALMN